jgi:hypothetical protein
MAIRQTNKFSELGEEADRLAAQRRLLAIGTLG